MEQRKSSSTYSGVKTWFSVLIAVLLCACLVVGTGILVLGVLNERSQSETGDGADGFVSWTTVTEDAVAWTVPATLHSDPAFTVTVAAQGVVTRDGAVRGTQIGEGNVLAVINESPVIIFTGAIPVYRDLAPGISGTDVSQLQDALRRLGYNVFDAQGVYGDSTALAVFDFYTSNGFTPSDISGSPTSRTDGSWKNTALTRQSVVFAPSLPVVVVSSCGVRGVEVSGELCRVMSSERSWSLQVDSYYLSQSDAETRIVGAPAASADGVVSGTVGELVEQSATGATGDTTADSVGTDVDGSVATRKVRYAFAVDTQSALDTAIGDVSMTVTLARSADGALSVETAAVGGSEDNSWVELPDGSHANVTIDVCHSGRCSFTSGVVKAGTRVKVFDSQGGEGSDVTTEGDSE